MRKLSFIVALLFLAGCSSSKVVYDYDAKANFSKYKTYHFFDDLGDGLNKFDVQRFTRSLDHVLDSMQLKKEDNPSFFINVISDRIELVQDDIGVGLGSAGRNLGVGISTGVSFGGKKIYEQVTIDFVDAQSNQLFWQGVLKVKTRETIKPEKRVQMIHEIVKKILSKYPPKN